MAKFAEPPISKVYVHKGMTPQEAYGYFMRELCHRYCSCWKWPKDSFPHNMAKDGHCTMSKFKTPHSIYHEQINDPEHNRVSCNLFKLATAWKISRALIRLAKLTDKSTPPDSL